MTGDAYGQRVFFGVTPAAVETSAPPLKPCPWCGRTTCPDRWEHDRLHAGSETTWRRARVAAAVLTPDDPALPGGTP